MVMNDPANPERGFSLVELMVALAISLVVILAVTQIFVSSEGQRRTTGAGVDAQTAAAIGLYSIERDIGSAGYAINSSNIRGCSTFYSYYDSDGNGPTPGAPVPDMSAFPVRIMDNVVADGGSDRIIVTSGSTTSSGMPTQLADNMAAPQDDVEVSNISGCVPNGFAILSDGGKCTFMQITAVDSLAFKLKHEYKDTNEPTYNPPITYLTDEGWPKYSIGNTALCLSNAITQRTYSVNVANNTLVFSSAGANSDITPDIVSLQAQYGISATGASDQVVNWVNATGSWACLLYTSPSPRD